MSINTDLFYFINNNLQNPLFDSIIPVITHFGGFIWLLVIVLVIIIYAKLKNKQTLKKVAIIALVALLFSDLITLLLKQLVQEPRPFMILDNVRLLIPEDDPCSFPSGHSSSTLAVVTIFVLNMKKLTEKHYRIISVFLILFGVIIPFSRVYCGVHFPGDVLVGALIGLIGALIVNRFKDKILDICEKII